MLNTSSWDPLHVANYVVEYLDLVESLPFDLQRNVSHMREIDSRYQGKYPFLITVERNKAGLCVCWTELQQSGAQ